MASGSECSAFSEDTEVYSLSSEFEESDEELDENQPNPWMEVARMKEAHFFSLPSQSNIYGVSSLCWPREATRVLVATQDKGVFSLELRNLIPSSQEVQFTYIPAGAAVTSLDVFNRSKNGSDYVIGITFVKNGDQYFNIYTSDQSQGLWYLVSTSQGCLSLHLDFLPYQLTHAKLFGEEQEMVWLLTGSDQRVHLYGEERDFTEKPIEDHFPELAETLPSIVYWLDVFYIDHFHRITAVGCEDGLIKMAYVAFEQGRPVVKRTCSIQHDSIISKVCLFQDTVTSKPDDPIHLVVTSTLEVSVVYRDVLNHQFQQQYILPNSNKYDCTTTALVANSGMDENNRILLTTYGHELLIYRWTGVDYHLELQYSFGHPLLNVSHLDFTGDGICELVVLSTHGVHVLQHDLDWAVSLCQKRLEALATTDD